MIAVTKDSKPLLIAFRDDWHELTPTISKDAMFNSTQFRFRVATNWVELTDALRSHPAVILLHQDMACGNDVPLVEFVHMIKTLCKIALIREPMIGIAIEKHCTPEMMREFRQLDIAGIVPVVSNFGISRTMHAIDLLLAHKQSWPKDLVSEIMNSKKQSRCKHEIRLTARQKQVMELVCHRGLPNKTIAAMLNITESTVKIHISAILKEYGVRNRTQLALAARDALHD